MTNRTRTDFGERLALARKRKGLSQPQLAALVGVAQSTIGEAETTAIGSKHTVQLATALGVRATWLANGEGEMLDATSWPFVRIDIERVLRLSPEDLAYVEGRLESALETVEVVASAHKVSPTSSATRGVPARFPGEVLSTERGKGKQGEVNQPAAAPPKGSRKRA